MYRRNDCNKMYC